MIKNLLGSTCSKAHIKDSQLVLSLTDAVTPVIWIINLREHPSLLLKVESSDDGFFVLQKVTSNGTTITTEDLGYYTKKGPAIRAMEKATQAVGGDRKTFVQYIWCGLKIVTVIAALAFFTSGTKSLPSLSSFSFSPSQFIESLTSSDAPAPETEKAPQPQQQETTSKTEPSQDMKAVGVPLSADAFLKRRSGRLF